MGTFYAMKGVYKLIGRSGKIFNDQLLLKLRHFAELGNPVPKDPLAMDLVFEVFIALSTHTCYLISSYILCL